MDNSTSAVNALVDTTGVKHITVLPFEHANIVFFGDKHAKYDPYKPNVLHEWIDLEVTKKETSFVVAEGVEPIDLNYILSLLPNYFSAKNVYFCDKIRFDLLMINNIKQLDHTKIFIDYLNKVNTLTENLTVAIPRTIDATVNGLNISHISSYQDKKTSQVIAFIKKVEESKKKDHLYGQFKSNDEANVYLEYLKSPYVNIYQGSYHFNDNSLKNKLMRYELCVIHYMYCNFAYRVANWIARMNPILRLNVSIYADILTMYRNVQIKEMKQEKLDNYMVYNMCAILDFVMIWRILDLYEAAASAKDHYLIWVPAGDAHTRVIMSFLNELMRTYKITARTIEDTLDLYDVEKHEVPMPLEPFSTVGFKSPQTVDLTAWDLSSIDEYSKPQLLNFLITVLSKRTDIFTNKIQEMFKILNSDYINEFTIQRLIPLIKDKTILKSFDESTMKNILCMNVHMAVSVGLLRSSSFGRTPYFDENNNYKYTTEKSYAFTDSFTGLYIPAFTETDKANISVYNMRDCINDPKNIKFSEITKKCVCLPKLDSNDIAYRKPDNIQEPVVSCQCSIQGGYTPPIPNISAKIITAVDLNSTLLLVALLICLFLYMIYVICIKSNSHNLYSNKNELSVIYT